MGLARYILLIIYFWNLLEPCKSQPYAPEVKGRMKAKIQYLYYELIKDSVKRVQSIKHFKDLVHTHAIYQAGELQYYVRKKFLRMMLIYHQSKLNVTGIRRLKHLKFLNEMHKLSFEIDNLVQMLEDNHARDSDEDLMPDGFDKHKNHGPNMTNTSNMTDAQLMAQHGNHPGSLPGGPPGRPGGGGGGDKDGGGGGLQGSAGQWNGRLGGGGPGGVRSRGFGPGGRLLRKGQGILQMGPPHIVHSQAQSVQRLKGGYVHALGPSLSNNERLREIKKQKWLLRNKKLKIESHANKDIAAIRLESGFDSDFH